jgi:AhpD family alkylhydroperoxidase
MNKEVEAIFEDIRKTRQTDYVNNFWHSLAADPVLLRRTWDQVKAVMATGVLDPLVKEMIYVAVSVTNQCGYCIATHSAAARAKGMTEEMFCELMSVVGLANQTNRLAAGFQVPIDERFRV